MITGFGDLTEAERGVLAGAARDEADRRDGARRARWLEIADAVERGGKAPHGVEPGRWTELPDAGTGGYC